ncbi:MAG: hypothetical protein Q8P13_00940 [bacterium]|nr:hypothetical protein [bacterium]
MKSRLIIAIFALLAILAAGASNFTAQAKEGRQDRTVSVNCADRVVSFTEPTTVEDRNAFLVSAMAEFKAKHAEESRVATPQEEAAFIEMVKRNAPVEVVVTAVMTDNPNLLPPALPDPDDRDEQGRPKLKRFKEGLSFEKFGNRVRQHGCRPQRGSSEISAMSVTTSSVVSGWYYCTAEAYAKNITGQKLIRLIQRQDWLVSIYGTIQDWDPVDIETYAYLNWKVSGAASIVGPKWLTYPWQAYASAKQKFILDYKVYTVQNKYLSTSLTVGPGSKCIMSPTKGPGMP